MNEADFLAKHGTNLRLLVTCFLGEKASSKQFRKYEQILWNLIRDRRFTSTNSYAVRRSITDMADRFHSESMADFATTFRYLCKVILECPDWKLMGEVDLEWSVIDFLIGLTIAPIQNVRRNRLAMNEERLKILDKVNKSLGLNDSPSKLTENDDASLIELLKEDCIPLTELEHTDSDEFSSNPTSKNASEDESLSPEVSTSSPFNREIKRKSKPFSVGVSSRIDCTSYLDIKDEVSTKKSTDPEIALPVSLDLRSSKFNVNWSKLPNLPPLHPPQPVSAHKEVTINREELKNKIHASWWLPDVHVITEPANESPCSNFAISFAKFRNEYYANLIDIPIPKIVTENYLLREIIFMFFEPVSCCFFDVSNEKITVRENVTICSVSAETMKDVLKDEILPSLQAMYYMKHIINENSQNLLGHSTITLQDYAAGLDDLLQPFKEQLMAFQSRLINGGSQDDTFISFIRFLKKEAKQLNDLMVITKKTNISDTTGLPHMRSSYLLATLFDEIRLQSNRQNLALVLLMSSLRAYCDILETWWMCGTLEDNYSEFIATSMEEETDSHTSIKLRALEETQPGQDIVKVVQECPLYKALREHTLFSAEAHDMLTYLQHLAKMMHARNEGEKDQTVHSEVTALVCETLKKFSIGGDESIINKDRENILQLKKERAQRKQEHKEVLESLDFVENKELLGVLTSHYKRDDEPDVHELLSPSHNLMFAYFESCSSLQLPLQDFVLETLNKVLHQRRLFANAYLMQVYREELKVSAHVDFLRQILLMESDYILYPFYTNFFRRVELSHDWAEKRHLTNELFAIIGKHYPTMATNLHLEVISPVRAKTSKVYEAVDAIEWIYDMDESLKRIIPPKHMSMYNNICRLMLKVKWAAWKLENLAFIRRASRDVFAPLNLLDFTVRRMEMLRFWLLFVINSLHSHFCTAVLQSFGADFNSHLPKCNTIRELHSLHYKYMCVLAKHCLLTPEFADFRTALEQLFHLIYVLDMEWSACIAHLNESNPLSLASSIDSQSQSSESSDNVNEYLALNQVVEIEMTYIRCHQMLANIIHFHLYKKDNSFLLALEVALSDSVPY